MAIWVVSHYLLQLPYAYLASLAAALGAYALLALTEPHVSRQALE